MSACRFGHLKIVDRLLAARAQPDVQMKVCYHEFVIIKQLLDTIIICTIRYTSTETYIISVTRYMFLLNLMRLALS